MGSPAFAIRMTAFRRKARPAAYQVLTIELHAGYGRVAAAPASPLGSLDGSRQGWGRCPLSARIGARRSATRLSSALDDVQSPWLPGTGHFVAEEAPDEILAALTAFWSRIRDGAAAGQSPSV